MMPVMLRGRRVEGLGYVPVAIGPSRPVLSTRPPTPKPSRPVVQPPETQTSVKPYPTAVDGYLTMAQSNLQAMQAIWNQYASSLKAQSTGDPCTGIGADASLLPLIMQASQGACMTTHYAQLAALGWAFYVGTDAAWAQAAVAQKANVAACTLAPYCTDPDQEVSFGLVAYTSGSGGSTSGGFQCVDGAYAGCVSSQVSAAGAAVKAALAAKALSVS